MRKLMVALLAMLVAAVSAMGGDGLVPGLYPRQPQRRCGAYYWIGADPSFGTQFDGADLGTISPVRTWTSARTCGTGATTADRTGGAYYWTIDGGTTPNEVIWTHFSIGGNNFQGPSTPPTISPTD